MITWKLNKSAVFWPVIASFFYILFSFVCGAFVCVYALFGICVCDSVTHSMSVSVCAYVHKPMSVYFIMLCMNKHV